MGKSEFEWERGHVASYSSFLVFPSGLLHFPFFVMDAPKYVNYGALGMIMGQEITQSFDDLG